MIHLFSVKVKLAIRKESKILKRESITAWQSQSTPSGVLFEPAQSWISIIHSPDQRKIVFLTNSF